MQQWNGFASLQLQFTCAETRNESDFIEFFVPCVRHIFVVVWFNACAYASWSQGLSRCIFRARSEIKCDLDAQRALNSANVHIGVHAFLALHAFATLFIQFFFLLFSRLPSSSLQNHFTLALRNHYSVASVAYFRWRDSYHIYSMHINWVTQSPNTGPLDCLRLWKLYIFYWWPFHFNAYNV